MTKNRIIGKGTEYPLQGIITFPDHQTAQVPAVVLVQGSGPSDKDETILKVNKPFRDIAEYFATKGIATIRYDKRTFKYGKKMMKKDAKGLTVREETIEDAILATDILRQEKRIDSKRIYILGHSLGGMLAPRIDAEGGNFAGIIIWAASPRNLTDIMIDQGKDLISQSGKLVQMIAKKQVSALHKKFDAIPKMSEEEAKNTKILGSMYTWYLKEMMDKPPADYLQKTKKPVLIMQGEKDFQVTMEKDFALYKEICAGMPNVSFKSYPDLNHLFMKSIYGTVKDYKKEYKVPAKVDTKVLDDIVEWIGTH